MYNFALAFVLCAVAYLIGDAVSILTKAWVPPCLSRRSFC